MQLVSRLAMLVVVGISAPVSTALADSIVCDLTNGGSCTINGGIFTTIELQPTGTGAIDSFVRVQNKDTEQGYNTSYRPVQFDEKTDPNFTRDLLLSEVGTTVFDGTPYATFYLDINEASGNSKDLLTLDQLEVFTTDLALRTGYIGESNTASGALPGTTKVYDLDFGGDNYVQLSYDLFGGGSGQSDLAFYLPLALFTGDYVNLFSQFGNIDGSANKYAADAGFEEWFTTDTPDIQPIPEPGTMGLIGAGLAALVRARKRRAQ